jgi:serine/threonine protein kinase
MIYTSFNSSSDLLIIQLGLDLIILGNRWDQGLSYTGRKCLQAIQPSEQGQTTINNDTAFPSRVSSSQEPASSSIIPEHYRHLFSLIPSSSISFFGLRGAGEFCKVYKGEMGMVPVAIKVFRDSIVHDRIMSEVYLHATSRHPFIVNYLGYNIDNKWMVMEDMVNGPIWHKLTRTLEEDASNRGVSPLVTNNSLTKRLVWCLQIATALQHLHSLGRFHCDLNSKNVLLGSHCRQAKLADFGLTEERIDSNGVPLSDGEHVGKQTGTIRWMSPEMFKSDCRSLAKNDIWGIALVIMEILTGYQPYFRISNMSELKSHVARGNVDTMMMDNILPTEYHPLVTIVKSCLSTDPSDRPDLSVLVRELSKLNEKNEKTSEWMAENLRRFGQSGRKLPSFDGNLSLSATSDNNNYSISPPLDKRRKLKESSYSDEWHHLKRDPR